MMEANEENQLDGMIFDGQHQNIKLLIRSAKHQDYDSILDINRDVYFGADYLPAMYHKLLDDKKMTSFVAETDNRIIAFVAFLIGDCNRLLTSIAARIQTDYSNKKIYQFIKGTCVSALRMYWPTVRHVWDVSIYTPQIETSISKSGGMMIEKWNHIACVGSVDQLRKKSLRTKREPMKVHQMSAQATKSLLSNPKTVATLFPQNFLLLASRWTPVRTTPESLNSAAEMCDFFVTNGTDNEIIALSTCYVYPCSGGFTFMMSYMGKEDQEMLIHHICNYMEYCLKVSGEEAKKIILKVAFPWNIDRDNIATFISEDFIGEFVDAEYGALYQHNLEILIQETTSNNDQH